MADGAPGGGAMSAGAPAGPKLSRTLLLYVTRLYLKFIGGIGGSVLAIYLVTDFVDRAKDYQGPRWVQDAAALYAFKALVILHQLAPAVMLLAAAATVTTLRKRGELTAIQSLSFGPRAVYLPVGLTTLVAALLLVGFDETVVVHAVQRSEQLTAERFHRWGEWRLHFTPKRWFRHDNRIFYLRDGNVQDGYHSVSVLSFDQDFRLRERIDAERMTFVTGQKWLLEGVNERTFDAYGTSHLRQMAEATYSLGVGRSAFNIQLGRPEQMRVPELLQQIRNRSQGGLPTQPFRLALHNRFAYPMMALPAALLAAGLAMRPGRRGQLTIALVEGMGINVILWAMIVVSRTLVQTERLSPFVAAWGPALVITLPALWLWGLREGLWTPRQTV